MKYHIINSERVKLNLSLEEFKKEYRDCDYCYYSESENVTELNQEEIIKILWAIKGDIKLPIVGEVYVGHSDKEESQLGIKSAVIQALVENEYQDNTNYNDIAESVIRILNGV